eukprot:360719-Chlamydomonas_euryale.AAC.2
MTASLSPPAASAPWGPSGLVACRTHLRRLNVLHATQAVKDLIEGRSVSRVFRPAAGDELGHLRLKVGRQLRPLLQLSDLVDDLRSSGDPHPWMSRQAGGENDSNEWSSRIRRRAIVYQCVWQPFSGELGTLL